MWYCDPEINITDSCACWERYCRRLYWWEKLECRGEKKLFLFLCFFPFFLSVRLWYKPCDDKKNPCSCLFRCRNDISYGRSSNTDLPSSRKHFLQLLWKIIFCCLYIWFLAWQQSTTYCILSWCMFPCISLFAINYSNQNEFVISNSTFKYEIRSRWLP